MMSTSISTKKRVTIADVARKVGYSTTVVSHALNGYARINEQTRTHIQQVARKMGFRPNIFARNLVTQTSQLVGIVAPGIVTSFYPEVILPLKIRLEEAGYGLLIMTSDDSDQEEQRSLDLLRERKVDALVVVPHKSARDGLRYDEIAGDNTPVVMIDRWLKTERCHSVTTDNLAGAEMATGHLLALGHRRIGVVKARSLCSTTRERMAGYKKALSAAGVAFDRELVHVAAYNIGRDLCIQGEDVLHSLLRLERPPTALFILHDVLAVGIMSAAIRFGIRMPEELSMVGFDDVEVVRHLPVPLTTVAQDKLAMGRIASELVLQSLADPKTAKQHIRLPPQLVVRKSTCMRAGGKLDQ
ncbi:MAG: LacI family DNA-binding transcriptional regulator [Acidobacteriota bacterium]